MNLPAGRGLSAALIGVLCLALAAAIVLRSGDSLVSRGPNSSGGLAAAWKSVNDPKAGAEVLGRAEAAARQALRREPLNTNAAALIGSIRAREGKAAEAEALMVQASRLNHRENIADLWLFQTLMGRKDYAGAILHADALLRRETAFTQQLFPQLAQATADPASLTPLAKRLAKDPSWRADFVYALIGGYTDPTGAFGILSGIKSAGGQLHPAETTAYLTRLVGARQFDQAYLAWILFLPDDLSSKIAFVYDGDFANLPDTRPFGWELGAGSVDPDPKGENKDDDALLIQYDGVSDRNFPSQLVILPPGNYRLTGEVMSETRESAGRVEWRILCDGIAAPLAAIAAPQSADAWTKFEVPFTVPAACPAQHLTLVARPTDRRVDVQVWYDKLNIEPVRSAGT